MRSRLAEALHGLARRIDPKVWQRPLGIDADTLAELRDYYDNNSTADDLEYAHEIGASGKCSCGRARLGSGDSMPSKIQYNVHVPDDPEQLAQMYARLRRVHLTFTDTNGR